MTTPKHAVAYLRVSGPSQESGDGFARQQEAVDGVATAQGFQILHTFRETISGDVAWDERPVFADMIRKVVDSEVLDTIVVENLGRLTRSYTVQEGILMFLASKDVNLVSADTGENITEAVRKDPMKKALIRMQGIFFQLEKNNMVARLKTARERKKIETGRCEGQKAFGTLNEKEAETLNRMIELRTQGLGMREIAASLNTHSYPTRNGRPWHFSSVAKILSRIENTEPAV